MLVPRAAGAAAVVGDDIIVSAGQANHQLVKDTEMFDGTKWKEIGAASDASRPPRRGVGRPLLLRDRRAHVVVRQELGRVRAL